MAKKIVRGITDVKTINNQDFDTNNVNDLLSDGQYNYIHRKKGKNEEYHNLTDNIKTISSDNTELLSVTNNNKTTNTATLHPKHDAQKEQVLESTRNTVNIQHGTNGTAEKTTVDTNPKKVLEHEKLKTGDGLTTSFNTDETTIMFKATKKPRETNLNTLGEGVIYGKGFSIEQVPSESQDLSAAYVTINISDSTKVQFYIREQGNDYGVIRLYYRFIKNGEVTEWRKMPGDRSDLNYELAQKEQLLESTRNTVTINHGTNGTDEKTTVNTNPEKVLEHENLLTDYGISKTTTGNTTKLGIEYTKVGDNFDLNNLENGKVRSNKFVNAPSKGWFFVSAYSEGDYTIQEAIALVDDKNTTYRRTKQNGVWGAWREQAGDKESRVVVAKDGSGDFKTVQSAIDSFAEGSNVHIVLKEGTYSEAIKVNTKFNNFILEGVSRDLCSLTSTSGKYKDSTILVSGNFTIRNMSVVIQNDTGWRPTYDTDDVPNTFPGYALHIDQPSLDDTKLNYGLVENCLLFSHNAFPAVGMGTWKNQKVEFRNCKINRWVTNDVYKNQGYQGSFLCHSSNLTGNPNQELVLVNNTFECNYGKSAHIRGGLGKPSDFKLYAVNNMFYSYELGHDSVEYEKSTSILHPASYGNTATNLNNTN